MKNAYLFCAVLALTQVCAPVLAAQATFDPLEPIPLYGVGTPTAINSLTQAAGYMRDKYGALRAVLWDALGNGFFLGMPQGYVQSLARDINEDGWVAGTVYDATGKTRAALWKPGEPVFLIPLPLKALSGGATGINNRGEVVGYFIDSTGCRKGFFWSPNIGIVDVSIRFGPCTSSEAYDINDLGQVVGTCTTLDGNSHGFIWTLNSGTYLTPLAPGQIPAPWSINNLGQIAGWSATQAAFWDAAGNVIAVGPPALRSAAYGINNHGQVVGFSTCFDPNIGTRQCAFVWTSGGGMQYLPPLQGDVDSVALGINDLGQIVGTSSNSSTTGVLWVVPETSGLLALTCGVAGLAQFYYGSRRSRRRGDGHKSR